MSSQEKETNDQYEWSMNAPIQIILKKEMNEQ